MKRFFRQAKAFYKLNPSLSNCPTCGQNGTVSRSHSRDLLEKVISSVTFYKYYKCKKCGWRGAKTTIAITRQSIIVILLYLLLIVGAGLITYQILKRLL